MIAPLVYHTAVYRYIYLLYNYQAFETFSKSRFCYNDQMWGGRGKMAQWWQVLAVNPNDLRSTLGTHMVEGENWLFQVVLWLPCARPDTCFSSPHQINIYMTKMNKKINTRFDATYPFFIGFSSCLAAAHHCSQELRKLGELPVSQATSWTR